MSHGTARGLFVSLAMAGCFSESNPVGSGGESNAGESSTTVGSTQGSATASVTSAMSATSADTSGTSSEASQGPSSDTAASSGDTDVSEPPPDAARYRSVSGAIEINAAAASNTLLVAGSTSAPNGAARNGYLAVLDAGLFQGHVLGSDDNDQLYAVAARSTGEFMAVGLTRGFAAPPVDASLQLFGASDEPAASWTIARHWATGGGGVQARAVAPAVAAAVEGWWVAGRIVADERVYVARLGVDGAVAYAVVLDAAAQGPPQRIVTAAGLVIVALRPGHLVALDEGLAVVWAVTLGPGLDLVDAGIDGEDEGAVMVVGSSGATGLLARLGLDGAQVVHLRSFANLAPRGVLPGDAPWISGVSGGVPFAGLERDDALGGVQLPSLITPPAMFGPLPIVQSAGYPTLVTRDDGGFAVVPLGDPPQAACGGAGIGQSTDGFEVDFEITRVVLDIGSSPFGLSWQAYGLSDGAFIDAVPTIVEGCPGGEG